MQDNADKVAGADRSRITADDYEVRNLAKKYKLNADQARELIALYGSNRQRLHAAAKKIIT
jgi:hypothetical protein